MHHQQPDEDKDGVDGTFVRILLGGVLGILLLSATYAVVILHLLPEPDEHGTFGDLFGGLNTLFSGLAFLGLILAILLQRQELREQRKEFQQAREAHEATAKALQDQLVSAERAANVQAINLLLSTYRERAESLRNPQTARDAVRYRRSISKISHYEAELERVLDRKLPSVK